MNTQSGEATTAPRQSFETFLEKNPHLNDPATLEGMAALLEKLAPLLQLKRFHNVVDLLSAVSDVVDMTDDAMVQKMMKGYEDVAAGAFTVNNAVRYAEAQAGAEHEPPSTWQLFKRLNSDADARRGLAMAMSMLGLLGRQAKQNAATIAED